MKYMSCTHELQHQNSIEICLYYIPTSLDSELLFVKPSLGLARCLLIQQHQITMQKLIVVYAELYDISNRFCAPFIRWKTSGMDHFNVLTNKAAYNRRMTEAYVDAPKVFTRNMHELASSDDLLNFMAQIIAQEANNLDEVITSGIQDSLPRR